MQTRNRARNSKQRDETFDEDSEGEEEERDNEDMFGDTPPNEAESTNETGRNEQTGPATTSMGQGGLPQSMIQGGIPKSAQSSTYSAVVTAIDNAMKVTTTTVEEEIKWQLGAKVKREEIAQQTEIKVFMILRPNKSGRTISLLHSISQCWTEGCRGKYIAFTGDATDVGNTLTAVMLQGNKTWELVKKTISTDIATLVTEVAADPTLKNRVWTCNNTMKEVEFPRIMHVPLCLAKIMYSEGKGYTPYDVIDTIGETFADDAGNVPAYWESISTWCLMALQADELRLDVAAIIDPDRDFARWMYARIATTVGHRISETSGGLGQRHSTTGDDHKALATAVSQGVALVMLQQGTNNGLNQSQKSNGGKEAKEGYDFDDKSRIMGFSHVDKFRQVQVVWTRIQNKKPETARMIVMELMTEAAFNKRVMIERTFYIDEKNMKDIQKLKFNAGPVATFSSAYDGLTPLICRSRSAAEQAFLVKKEAAMAETIRTRTLEEALEKPKYDPKFPDNFQDMKTMLDTFMIMMWVLFGEWSPIYIQLNQVSLLLNERQVQMTARAYTPAACYRIMWSIYEEVRRFFDQGLLADAFKANSRIQFPDAYISAFLNDIRVGNTIMRSSYPSELLKIENNGRGGVGGGGGGGGGNNTSGRGGRGGNQSQRGGRGRGGRGTGGPPYNGGGGYNSYNGGGGNNNYAGGGGYYNNNGTGGGGYGNNGYNNGTRNTSNSNSNNSRNNGGRGLRNAKIEAMMSPYRQKFPGHVNVFHILEECGYRLTDLPPSGIADKDTGKQMFCWPYGLGCCTYPRCKFAAVGGHPENVSEEFADATCTLLGPCMQKILNNGQSPPKKYKSEGGGSN